MFTSLLFQSRRVSSPKLKLIVSRNAPVFLFCFRCLPQKKLPLPKYEGYGSVSILLALLPALKNWRIQKEKLEKPSPVLSVFTGNRYLLNVIERNVFASYQNSVGELYHECEKCGKEITFKVSQWGILRLTEPQRHSGDMLMFSRPCSPSPISTKHKCSWSPKECR